MWTGFATPSHHTDRATICRDGEGGYLLTNEMELSSVKLDSVTVQKFLSTLMVPCPMPDAKAFGRSQEVLDWHFGGCSTDDYPAMIVEIEWDNGSVTTLSTHSNHAHLLPWKIESENTVESYLPDISMTLSELLPDSFLSQKRLASSDAIFAYRDHRNRVG